MIEDAAHACTATFRGKAVGGPLAPGMPYASCFSFYATKTLATGEGGMITTDDEQCAERVRLMSLHGISKDAWKRYTAEGTGSTRSSRRATNTTCPTSSRRWASPSSGGLTRCGCGARRSLAAITKLSRAALQLEIPTVRAHVGHAWHLYILRLNTDLLSIGRNEFIDELKAAECRHKRALHSAAHPPLLPGHLRLPARRPAGGVP